MRQLKIDNKQMRKSIAFIGFFLVWSVTSMAQISSANYRYQVKVENQRDASVIEDLNQFMDHEDRVMEERTAKERGVLGQILLSSYSSVFLQKTLNASSQLLDLGADYLIETARKNTKAHRFREWQDLTQAHNSYTKVLATDTKINDFYYMPSSVGPFDARYLKFNGVTCYNYLESTLSDLEGEEENGSGMGHDAFYIHCSLRADSLGLAEMAHHSKFLLKLDTLAFYPDWCNVPLDNKARGKNRFNYAMRTGLRLSVVVKVFASWITPTVQLQDEVQLGQFTIHASIPERALIQRGDDRVFIYNGTDKAGDDPIQTASLVSISGDSFVVPRSYVSGIGADSWGTGQYRLEITVTESCYTNDSYYLAPDSENLRGINRYDKNKWMAEWKQLHHKDNRNFFKDAWAVIKSAYIKGDWAEELIDPAKSALFSVESQELRKVFDF